MNQVNITETLHSALLPSRGRRYSVYLVFAVVTTLLVYFHRIHPRPPLNASEFDSVKNSMFAFSHVFGVGFIRESLLILTYVLVWAGLVGLITAVAHEFTHYVTVPGFSGRARFGMNTKKFIPSVIPKISLSKFHYIAIAIAPLILVNCLCIAFYFLADIRVALTAFGVFLTNTIGSTGDVFSANYVRKSKAKWFKQSEDRLAEYY